MTLGDYFQAEGQSLALAAYADFACGKDWAIQEKMELYDVSLCAFDPAVGEDDGFKAFDKIYSTLAGSWRVFRPDSPAVCWPSRLIFETIKRDFAVFAWGSPVTLIRFLNSKNRETFLSDLDKMKGIKSNQSYPVMTVSKFLHFYNPSLFPIYDYEVIWKKVLKRFKGPFKEFCSKSSPPYDPEDSAVFFRNYMCWASSLLLAAHPKFMEMFVDWLGKQRGSYLPKRKFNASSLHATAFEFTVIGAAEIELRANG